MKKYKNEENIEIKISMKPSYFGEKLSYLR